MESAYEFGNRHKSCIWNEREQFDIDNPGAGQAGFYRHCNRGDYLLWQLRRLPHEQISPLRGAFYEIARRAAERAMEYADNCAPERAASAAEWAESAESALSAAESVAAWLAAEEAADAAWDAAWAAWAAWAARAAAGAAEEDNELAAQAADIHELIPEWPG